MKSLKFSCPDDMRAWIERKATRESRSESSVIREAVYKAMQTPPTVAKETGAP